MPPVVRDATSHDAAELAKTLASAFSRDPVFTWMVPERRQLERLRIFFAAAVSVGLRNGTVHTSEGLDCAAVWLPPDRWKASTGDIFRMLPAMTRALGLRVPRALGALNAMEKRHPKDPPHWYLEALGTHGDAQRGGVGSAVIGRMLQRCDHEGVPAYLESSNPENIPFYRRHGFEVTEVIPLAKNGPSVTGMWRDPR